ncbi:MAG: energy transducer TonB [Nitrospinota bacterium]
MRTYTSISLSITINILLFAIMIPHAVENKMYRDKKDLIMVDLIRIEKKKEPLNDSPVKILPEPSQKKGEVEKTMKRLDILIPEGREKEIAGVIHLSPPLAKGGEGRFVEPSENTQEQLHELNTEVDIFEQFYEKKDIDTSHAIPDENKNIPSQSTSLVKGDVHSTEGLVSEFTGRDKEVVGELAPPPKQIQDMVTILPGSGAGIGAENQVQDTITILPKFAKKIDPVYPEPARRLNREGTVIVEVSIDPEGRVIETDVIKSAGFGFDESVLDAINNSTFSPAKAGHKTVSVKIRIPFRFELR